MSEGLKQALCVFDERIDDTPYGRLAKVELADNLGTGQQIETIEETPGLTIEQQVGIFAISEAAALHERSASGLSIHEVLQAIVNKAGGTLTEDDAIFLINDDQWEIVSNNPNRFSAFGPRVFNLLLKKNIIFGHGGKLAYAFRGLGIAEANELIILNRADAIARNFDSFDGIPESEHLALACNIINSRHASYVFGYLKKYTGITPSDHIVLARTAVKARNTISLVDNFAELTGIDPSDHAEIVFGSINSDSVWRVANNIDKFDGLTKENYIEFVYKLVDTNRLHVLADSIDKFSCLTHEDFCDLADYLIKIGQTANLARRLPSFKLLTDTDHRKYAQLIIDTDPKGALRVGAYLSNFRGLDRSIAHTLIANGGGTSVIRHLIDSFVGLTQADYIELVDAVIDRGGNPTKALLCIIDKLVGANQRELVDKLIDRGFCSSVVEMYELFTGLSVLDDVEIFEKSLTNYNYKTLDNNIYSGPFSNSLVSNIDKFSGLTIKDYVRAADEEIAQRGVVRVLHNIEKLPGVDHAYIIDLARKAGLQEYVIDNASRFNVEIPIEVYAEASRATLNGFDQRWLGEFIKARLDNGLETSVYEATRWLARFTVLDTGYNMAEIKKLAMTGSVPETLPLSFNIDRFAEEEFFTTLYSTDLKTRQKLIDGDDEPALKDEEKLKHLLTLNSSVKSAYYQELRNHQAALTQEFYNELLSDDAILSRWHECEHTGMKQRRFFSLLFKERVALKQELSNRISAMRTELTDTFLVRYQNENGGADSLYKPIVSQDLFQSPQGLLLYQAMVHQDDDGVPLYKTADFTGHVLEAAAMKLHKSTGCYGQDHLLEQRSWFTVRPDHQKRPLSEITHDLQQTRVARKRYIQDVQTWLRRHATTHHEQIMHAWANRPVALAHGTLDGAAHINQWSKERELSDSLDRLEAEGRLRSEYGFTRNEFMSDEMEPIRNELLRVLTTTETLTTVSKLKKWRAERGGSVNQRIPASIQFVTTDTNREYRFEVLSKDDPRGCTIGEDTNCCMTVSSAAKTCIEAGYTREDAGFIALYRDNVLIAQSFWFVHPDTPNTLVIDNIEINKGRDLGPITDIYQQAIRQILASNPKLGITHVNVGARYSGVDLIDLEVATSVPNLRGVYTDAEHQRLLLSLD